MVRYIKDPLSVDGLRRGGKGREGGLIRGSLRYPVNGLGLPSLMTAGNYVKKTHHSFVVLEMGF